MRALTGSPAACASGRSFETRDSEASISNGARAPGSPSSPRRPRTIPIAGVPETRICSGIMTAAMIPRRASSARRELNLASGPSAELHADQLVGQAGRGEIGVMEPFRRRELDEVAGHDVEASNHRLEKTQ